MKGIPIGENYIIETLDQLNVVVKKRIPRKQKEGEPKKEDTWKVIGYHPNLEMAFGTIVDTEINATINDGIGKVVKKITELKKFKKLISEVK